jgi:hypothetical protein
MDKYSSRERALVRNRVTVTFATVFLIIGLVVCLHLFQQERPSPVLSSAVTDEGDRGTSFDEEASNDEAPPSSEPTLLTKIPNINTRTSPSLVPSTIEPLGQPSAFPAIVPSPSPSKSPPRGASAVPSTAPLILPSYRPSLTAAEPSILPTLRPSHISYFPGNLTREQSKCE